MSIYTGGLNLETQVINFVIPAKAGIQGCGVSFDKLRTNVLSGSPTPAIPDGDGVIQKSRESG